MKSGQNIINRFYEWIKVKIYLDKRNRKASVHEGEIWWASVGKNIGVEIDGKNSNFSRPVLILKKYNYHSFMAIPLTTKTHNDNRYVMVEAGGKQSYGVLIQGRTMSTSRLYRKICTIPEPDLKNRVNTNFVLFFTPVPTEIKTRRP